MERELETVQWGEKAEKMGKQLIGRKGAKEEQKDQE